MKTINVTQIINGNSQFFKDLINEDTAIMVNQNKMSKGYYNLITSIRDCGLYAKGIKPHRHWKISDVKTYFGIKGTSQSMYDQLQEIKNVLLNN